MLQPAENPLNGDDEDDSGPGERWDPLGADNDEDLVGSRAGAMSTDYEADGCEQFFCLADPSRIRSLEEEQEVLTTSLMALTSHFAQVQFRLRQIVDAPDTQREHLLKNLEEFAFRGIPEITGEPEDALANLERARSRQFELIDRLKLQLTELEKFAYESGAPVLPQSILVEKQKIIIDEMKNKLNLNVNDFDLPQLSSEDIKNQVDTAINEFVGPLKMKEQLVAQLKTQITDLERFIAFLQHCDNPGGARSGGDGRAIGTSSDKSAYNSYAAKKKHSGATDKDNGRCKLPGVHQNSLKAIPETTATFNNKAHGLLDKASTLLQMFAAAQFGCGSSVVDTRFETNNLKKSSRANHWGDTRAQLEVDIQEVVSLAMTLKQDRAKQRQQQQKQQEANSSSCLIPDSFDIYTSDSDDENADNSNDRSRKSAAQSFSLTNVELTSVVRRNFSVTLQKLIQHGLHSGSDVPNGSLVPFIGCFNHVTGGGSSIRRRRDCPRYATNESDRDDYTGQMHAWELILQYYNVKNGEQYNDTPARKLSQSFNLDIVGGNAISNKQSLLSVIGSIIALHTPYKRSYNSHFKAFVCAALNSHKLVVWLNLIFQCAELIRTYYTGWSYVSRTGFRDALRSLDRLTKYEFDLPVDLAVRQFQNIKDVFM